VETGDWIAFSICKSNWCGVRLTQTLHWHKAQQTMYSPNQQSQSSQPDGTPENSDEEQPSPSWGRAFAAFISSFVGGAQPDSGDQVLPSSGSSTNSVWGSGQSLGLNDDSRYLGNDYIRSSQDSQELGGYGSQNSSQYYDASLPRMSQSSAGSGPPSNQMLAFEDEYILDNQFLPSSSESGSQEPPTKRARSDAN